MAALQAEVVLFAHVHVASNIELGASRGRLRSEARFRRAAGPAGPFAPYGGLFWPQSPPVIEEVQLQPHCELFVR